MVDDPPDGGPDEGLTLGSPAGRLALLSTVAGSGMASLDATIVNVALPRMGDDLGADVGMLQWVLTGYLLALSSLILLGGALGDRYGRRRVFIIGTAWFALASAICGLAPNVELLVAGRVLQGVGAALLTPGSLAILQATFQPGERSKAVGAWSGLGGAVGAVGPFVGGWLVGGPGWRWGFLVNLPVAALVIGSARTAVPETRDPHAGRLDGLGALIAAAGLATVTWSLSEAGDRGWGDRAILGTAIVAALLLGLFVLRLGRIPNPLVPPALFASRTFTVMNLATVLLYAGLGVSMFLVAYHLQVAAGWSPLESGVALLPSTILLLIGSGASATLAERIGPRLPLTVGSLLAATGLFLLAGVGPDARWVTDVLPGAVVFGLGIVTFVAPLTATVMGSVRADQVSTASGVNNAVARTAALAALAVIPVLSGFTTATGGSSLTSAYRTAMVIAAVVTALAAPLCFVGLGERLRPRRSARHLHCAIDGPPLQPDPNRCPVTSAHVVSSGTNR